MPGGVVFERCIGRALSRAALIEKHYAIRRWVEELSILGHQPAARAPVQEHDRLALRIATLFVIDLMDLRHLQTASVVGFDWRIKGPELGHRVMILSPCSAQGQQTLSVQ